MIASFRRDCVWDFEREKKSSCGGLGLGRCSFGFFYLGIDARRLVPWRRRELTGAEALHPHRWVRILPTIPLPGSGAGGHWI
ncbi:hypothetical protein VTL71DRAFT_14563 [Oculimacula yallundae]|uniref:Uncharacterized protein n=1 Tax=Oculimacula yallundae TaxID=86028 RepID=A0ABR4CJD3_9HELO